LSYKAARKRQRSSIPMRYLYSLGLLKGRVLDFGCGYGFDVEYYNIEGYDPHFFPEMPTGLFNTIACIYVLNTLDEQKQYSVIDQVVDKLVVGGVAYFAVRRDIKKDKQGRGCIQRCVKLPFKSIKKTSGYEIYEINKNFSN